MPYQDALQQAIDEALLAAGAPEGARVKVENRSFGQDNWRVGETVDEPPGNAAKPGK